MFALAELQLCLSCLNSGVQQALCFHCFARFGNGHEHSKQDFVSVGRRKPYLRLPATHVWQDTRTYRLWFWPLHPEEKLTILDATFERPLALMRGWTWWIDRAGRHFFVNYDANRAQRVDPLHIPSSAWSRETGLPDCWELLSGPEAVATFSFEAILDDDLPFELGERIKSVKNTDKSWWHGKTMNGRSGNFPSNYVKLIEFPSSGIYFERDKRLASQWRPASHPCLERYPLPDGWILWHHGDPNKEAIFRTAKPFEGPALTNSDPRASCTQWKPSVLPAEYTVLESDDDDSCFFIAAGSSTLLKVPPKSLMRDREAQHVPFGSPVHPALQRRAREESAKEAVTEPPKPTSPSPPSSSTPVATTAPRPNLPKKQKWSSKSTVDKTMDILQWTNVAATLTGMAFGVPIPVADWQSIGNNFGGSAGSTAALGQESQSVLVVGDPFAGPVQDAAVDPIQ